MPLFSSFAAQFSASPGWFSLLALLFLFELTLIVTAMIRQGRKMIFASAASVFVGLLYAVSLQYSFLWNEFLSWFRPSFLSALMGHQGTLSFYHAQFLYFMGFLMLLGFVFISLFSLFSFFSLRFSFAKKVMLSIVDLPRQAFFLALFTLLMLAISPFALPFSNDFFLYQLIQLSSFFMLFQLFLRLIGSAKFLYPKAFVAFSFQTGLLMVFTRGLSMTLLQDSPFFSIPSSSMFFEQLFVFFLGILLAGIIGSCMARNSFHHLFRSWHEKRVSFISPLILSMLLLVPSEEALMELRLIMGVIMCFLFTAMLLLASFFSSFLILLPLFFVAYFFLFAMLDHYFFSS